MRLEHFVAFGLIATAAGGQQLSQAPPRPVAAPQTVTVTADRGLAGVNDAASSVAVLTEEQLQQVPGLTLDDSLHQVAGFQLFRRTSSWTANPTSSGVSLRGLGSTAASRTLVVSDQVPMNDAFGGWVHWSEIPAPAIRAVEVVRGGSAELYGSSAIGGVIDVAPMTAAEGLHVDARAFGATENTGSGDALVSDGGRRLAALGALSVLSTGGYIPVAPSVRGTVDIPANVIDQAARVELRRPMGANGWSEFLRGNLLNETRGNGTPLQTNAARVWRYVAGADVERAHSTGTLRVYGSREGYRQNFSSVTMDRDSEKLTKLQRVPSDELGLVAQASHLFARSVTAAMGFDARDIRGTDAETAPLAGNTTTADSARQRETGGYVDAIWQPKRWSVSGSVRVDSFRTFDARQVVSTRSGVTALPEIDELVASPRLGLVRTLPHGVALTATAFRAFRGPTLNELYRTSQVGQQVTLANNSLLAERATGFELGPEFSRAGWGHLRATYFWTEVNRPISAVLVSGQTYDRENLGQIRSRGLMVEAQSERRHGFDVGVGYQLAVATVTAFGQDSGLVGKWLPEVPRESVSATVNWSAPRVAEFHLLALYQGQEFDDAENQYLLHPFARFDFSAERSLKHGLSLFAGAQNLFNRQIQAGLTPQLTLASPRLVQAGLRYTFRR
ncbi:MAG TPA: TonB-dependent receptor [Acidobacteriaceae bacterium]